MLLFALSAAIIVGLSLPPARYDKPYEPMIVRHYSAAGVEKACRRGPIRHTRGQLVGCAQKERNGPRCFVHLIDPGLISTGAYQRSFRHERAHCHGWRHK